jgi:hypothetical protein
VRPGDTIQPTASIKARQVTHKSGWVLLDVQVRNQKGEQVAVGEAWSSFSAEGSRGMKLREWAALGLAFGLAAGGAVAQELPKSMRIIVPFLVGGTTGHSGALHRSGTECRHGISATADNRRRLGTVGSEVVARSPADGAAPLLTARTTSSTRPLPQASP